MAVVIELPKDRRSVSLADWMEVNAFLDEADHSSSLEDIVSELSVSNEISEPLKTDISTELLTRVKKLGVSYPFKFNGQLLEIKTPDNYEGQWAYILCLLISYIGVHNGEKTLKAWGKDHITSLFEEVSGIAAKNFLPHTEIASDFLYFGAPRASWKKIDRPFRSALKILKSKISDGEIIKIANDYRQKDAGLDIIAWRHFPDQRPGKLLLLCQCAAGSDYKSKRYELLNFKNFFSIRSPFFQALFIPHELDEAEWAEYCFDTNVGLTFDRGRIGWYAKDWDGDGFKSKFPKIAKRLKYYKKAF
jgi:hypothetical protein